MADAVAACKESIKAFRENPADFALYSIVAIAVGAFVCGVLALALITAGIISAGAINSIFFQGASISLGTLGMAFILLVLLAAFLISVWVVSGVYGAYLETLNAFSSGRKQTVNGFFLAIPRRATRIMGAAIIIGACAAAPIVAAAVGAAMLGGGAIAIALLLLGALLGLAVLVLFAFVMPAIVVDNKGVLQAISHSLPLAGRNIIALVVLLVILSALGLPMLVPFLGALYAVFAYMPVSCTALLILYKRAR